MSGITSASNVDDVIAAYNNYLATDAQMKEWGSLLELDAAGVTTKVGLFSADLTDFLADCAVAKAILACNVPDYDGFSGWAVGVEWSTDTAIDN